jgi:hypothetical protein
MNDEKIEFLADILAILDGKPTITYEHITSEAMQNFVYENEARFQRITGQYNPRPLDCIARALPHYGLQLKSDNGIWAGLGARYFVTQLADEHESEGQA